MLIDICLRIESEIAELLYEQLQKSDFPACVINSSQNE